MADDTSGFITGDDFIGFDLPDAGPSRSPTPESESSGNVLDGLRSPSPKGKEKANEVTKGKKRKSNGMEPETKRTKGVDTTGPRNLKEERRAAERGAPWAEGVKWEKCHDAAEM